MSQETRAKGESLACLYRKPSKNANVFKIDAKLENVYKQTFGEPIRAVTVYFSTKFNNIV